MPPRKHNSFMHFVDHYRHKYPGGRRAISVAAAVEKCGEIWRNMSAEQRKAYAKPKAKARDSVSQVKVVLKCDPIVEETRQMQRHIERIICAAKSSLDFQNQEYNIVAFNYFAKKGNVYVPAEYATCRYSLKEGIGAVYSTLIGPKHLIFGQTEEAIEHSRTTHRLPLPPMAFGRTMEKLYKKFIDDLSEGCQGDDPIIVYTATEQISMVKACYAYLACEADENESLNKLNRQLLVYDIQYLFYALKKVALSITGRPSDDITLQVTSTSFQGDYFDYTAGIACDYHEEIDSTKYCTRNMVIRWCYIFSDFICGDLDIQLKPGKHIPAVTEPSYNITLGEPEEIFYDCVSDCSWYAGDEGSNLDCDPPQGRANLWDDIPGMEQLSIQEISDEKWSIN